MTRFRDVNFFRLTTIVGLSVITNLIFFLADEMLTNSEAVLIILQTSLAGFSFLQCPEAGIRHDSKLNDRRKPDNHVE